MSRLDALLRKYKEQTQCEPPGSIEINVFSRLRNGGGQEIPAFLSSPASRLAAMAASAAIGLAIAVAPSVAASTAEEPVPELAVFAPDAPHLPSSWLGRIK